MAVIALGKITVAAAGTPVRLASTPTYCCAIRITPLSGNTGNVYPGDASLVVSTLAHAYHDGLSAGQQWELAGGSGGNLIDASLVFIDVDSGHNGEGVVAYAIQI